MVLICSDHHVHLHKGYSNYIVLTPVPLAYRLLCAPQAYGSSCPNFSKKNKIHAVHHHFANRSQFLWFTIIFTIAGFPKMGHPQFIHFSNGFSMKCTYTPSSYLGTPMTQETSSFPLRSMLVKARPQTAVYMMVVGSRSSGHL